VVPVEVGRRWVVESVVIVVCRWMGRVGVPVVAVVWLRE
jgi:hypothetical protein